MSAVFNSRAARRRAIAWAALLVTSSVLMGASANPAVVNLQRGIGFAFRPVMSTLDRFGQDLASIGAAVSEIDQLRLENEALRAENDRYRTENRQAEELRRGGRRDCP
ncbi:MAG: Cell shape-determining protein MreC [Chloroflexi bacterium]|nr:Cell shape-determining protein MreC [Chloroflexota bacterium]